MSTLTGNAFDSVASHYDEIWSSAPAGRHQRESLWRAMDPLFHSGQTILDIGCGTGVDALRLMSKGMKVDALDASAAMVEVARSKGVKAHHLPAEKLSSLKATYDGALSNFGVLNCVENLEKFSADLGALIRPRGHFALCVMGAFCLWETCHFLRSAQWRKAVRRWRSGGVTTSFGMTVWYPRVRVIARMFRREFRLVRWQGIGLAVPPSYVGSISPTVNARLARFDNAISTFPLLRGMADHRLLVFARI